MIFAERVKSSLLSLIPEILPFPLMIAFVSFRTFSIFPSFVLTESHFTFKLMVW